MLTPELVFAAGVITGIAVIITIINIVLNAKNYLDIIKYTKEEDNEKKKND